VRVSGLGNLATQGYPRLSAGISAAREGARRGWSSLRIDGVPGQVRWQLGDGSLMCLVASASRDTRTAKGSFTFLSVPLSLSSTTSPFPVGRWMIRHARCRSTRFTLDPPSDPLDPSALLSPSTRTRHPESRHRRGAYRRFSARSLRDARVAPSARPLALSGRSFRFRPNLREKSANSIIPLLCRAE